MSLRKRANPFMEYSKISGDKGVLNTTVNYFKNNTKTIVIGFFILIIIVLILLFNFYEPCRIMAYRALDNMNISGKKSSKYADKIMEMNILFFMLPTCPWSLKMVDVLNKEKLLDKVNIIDISTEEGKKIAESYGAYDKGVPNFVSQTYKTGTIGFKETIDELIDSLLKPLSNNSNVENVKNNQNNINLDEATKLKNAIRNMDIIFFKMEGCGHCTRVYNQLEQLGLLDVFEIIDPSSDLASNYIQTYKLKVSGFPMFYSKTTGKSTVGSKPVEKIVEELL